MLLFITFLHRCSNNSVHPYVKFDNSDKFMTVSASGGLDPLAPKGTDMGDYSDCCEAFGRGADKPNFMDE